MKYPSIAQQHFKAKHFNMQGSALVQMGKDQTMKKRTKAGIMTSAMVLESNFALAVEPSAA